MSRRRKFTPHTHGTGTFALNITSMTDMFTILLVFLLQSYSTSQVNIIPEKDIRLPSSNVTNNPVESIKLSISPNSLKIDGKLLAEVENMKFKDRDLDANDSSFILPLFNELNQLTKNDTKGTFKEGKILLQADSNLPYQTIKKIMYTASMAGFPQLKLVTVVGN